MPLSLASRCEASGTLPWDVSVGLRSLLPSVSRAQPGSDSGGGCSVHLTCVTCFHAPHKCDLLLQLLFIRTRLHNVCVGCKEEC